MKVCMKEVYPNGECKVQYVSDIYTCFIMNEETVHISVTLVITSDTVDSFVRDTFCWHSCICINFNSCLIESHRNS